MSEDMPELMHEVMDNFTVLEEAARGFRAGMEAEGWSPGASEGVAAHMLCELISTACRGVRSA